MSNRGSTGVRSEEKKEEVDRWRGRKKERETGR